MLTSGLGIWSEYSLSLIPRPPQKRTTFMGYPPAARLDHDFSTVEAFSVLPGCFRLDSSNSQKRQECVRGEPVFLPLGLEAVHYHADLFLADGIVEMNEEIGTSQIAVVFQDFIFQDELIPVGVPRQLGDQAMVLMEIVAVVGEDEIRGDPFFQLFEEALYLVSEVREEACLEIPDQNLLLLRARQEDLGAHERLS